MNGSYYCNYCSIEIDPSVTELRSKSKLYTSEGPTQNLYVAYPPEPKIGKQPLEVKGIFKMLKDKGL